MTKLFESLIKNRVIFVYIVCINMYAFTKYIFQIIVNHTLNGLGPSNFLIYSINFYSYFLIFSCGCLSGFLINKNTIIHASLITMLSMVFSVFLMTIRLTDHAEFFSILAISAILGAIGGGVSLMIKRYIINR